MNSKTLMIVMIVVLALSILGLSGCREDAAQSGIERSLQPLQPQVSLGVETTPRSPSAFPDRSSLTDRSQSWRLMEDAQRQAQLQQEVIRQQQQSQRILEDVQRTQRQTQLQQEIMRQQQQSQRIVEDMQRSQRQAQEQSQRIVDDMQRAQRQAQEQSQRIVDDMQRQTQQQLQRSLEDAARHPGALSPYQPPLYNPPSVSIPSPWGGAPGRP